MIELLVVGALAVWSLSRGSNEKSEDNEGFYDPDSFNKDRASSYFASGESGSRTRSEKQSTLNDYL